jgi:hypothetical protein
MMTVASEEQTRSKKQKPFSIEEERANVFTIGKEEIGLLDIVLLDGIVKNNACSQ